MCFGGHDKKTPSLCFVPSKNNWKCFGCGKGGDAISLAMGILACDFRTGLDWSPGSTSSRASSSASPTSVYHRHIKAFFEKVIPIIAKHQVTRGGRVILVQDENEYIFRNRPGGREHLVFLRDLLRKLGIDVPILVCNHFYERIDDTIECWNGWDQPERAIQMLRKAQPDTPHIITEFWPGWFSGWGHPAPAPKYPARAPRPVAPHPRRGRHVLVLHVPRRDDFRLLPRPYGRRRPQVHGFLVRLDAPLSETGGLTAKYYKAKLASTLASNSRAFFAESEPAGLAVTSPDDVEIVTRSSPQGNIIFVFNRSKRKRTAPLSLPGGVEYRGVVRGHRRAGAAVPFLAGAGVHDRLLQPLHPRHDADGRGEARVPLRRRGAKSAVLGAQGRTFRRTVGADTQMWFGNFPNLIAVMDTQRAERTWFLPDRTSSAATSSGDAQGEKTTVGCREERDARRVFPQRPRELRDLRRQA